MLPWIARLAKDAPSNVRNSLRDEVNDAGSEDQLPPQVRQAKSRVSAINLKLPDEGVDLEEIEREILVQVLERHDWNQSRAARYLNISRKTLIYRMDKLGLGESPETPNSIAPSE